MNLQMLMKRPWLVKICPHSLHSQALMSVWIYSCVCKELDHTKAFPHSLQTRFLSTVIPFMMSKDTELSEGFPTLSTFLGIHSIMYLFMVVKATRISKSFIKLLTCIKLPPSVNSFMDHKWTGTVKTFPMYLTHKLFISMAHDCMSLNVCKSKKAFPTLLAYMWFLSIVNFCMTLNIIVDITCEWKENTVHTTNLLRGLLEGGHVQAW